MRAATQVSGDRLSDPLRVAAGGSGAAVGLALVLSLAATLLMLVPPLYMINVFDKVLYSQSMSTLIGISIAGAIGILMFMMIDYLRSKLFLRVGSWLGEKLYGDLLQPALSRSLRTGGGATEAVRDIGELRHFVSGPSIGSALEFLLSPVFLFALFLMHSGYLLVTLGFAGIMVILGIVNELLVRGPTVAAKSAATVAYSDLGDAMRNAEVIESMGLMGNVLRRWDRSNRETLDAAEKAELRATAIRSISRGIQLTQTMCIIAVGALLVVWGEVTTGTLIAAMIISRRAIQPMDAVINSWRQWIGANEAAKRLRQLTKEDKAQAPRSGMALPRPTGRVEIDRLVFAPTGATLPIVRNVSLDVAPGEFVVIAGPSGAGKSTLAKLVVGIWAPTAGGVRFDGHDTYTWNREDFGQYVGYLPQQVELFSGTVRENIARLGVYPAPRVIEAAKRAGLHEMVGRFPHGYDTDVGVFGRRLTGGQRQRIGLARAFFGNPAILVLDEPDASLDADGQAALHRALVAAKEDGTTVIVVSHRPGLLKLADRIVLVREGAIEWVVRPEELVFDDRGLVGVKSVVARVSASEQEAQA